MEWDFGLGDTGAEKTEIWESLATLVAGDVSWQQLLGHASSIMLFEIVWATAFFLSYEMNHLDSFSASKYSIHTNNNKLDIEKDQSRTLTGRMHTHICKMYQTNGFTNLNHTYEW